MTFYQVRAASTTVATDNSASAYNLTLLRRSGQSDLSLFSLEMWTAVLAVVGLVTALYWYLSRQLGYWQRKGVHCLPGAQLVVGHMMDSIMLKKSASWQHCEFYNQGRGHAAVGVYSFSTPNLVLRDPQLIQTVLISEFSSFHDNTVDTDEKIDPYISKNPFVAKGERWKTIRTQLAPAFSPAKIKAMFPLINRVCQEFNSYMGKHLNENTDINYVTRLFTSEVVAKCAFAVDGDAFNDPNAVFYKNGQNIWDNVFYDPFQAFLNLFFPIINKVLRKGFFPEDTVNFFKSLILQAAEYRQKYPDKTPDNDYLNFLFNLQSKHPDFTIDDVVAQSLTFFTDGFETSSVATSFALYELAVNPDIQEALRKEVKALESFSYETITSLPLLDRVFQETMRKYSVFSIVRQCTKDYILQSDSQTFPINKGMHVTVPMYAIHNDPEIYPDPDKFDPDRFLPEHVKNRHSMAYMGFGAGPRTCIGNRFATCQVKTLIANIVANFRLVRCDKTVRKVELRKDQLLPVPTKGIWASFQRL